MTYTDALRWLYSFTNYETSARMPRTDLKLERMRRLLDLAGNPQASFPSVLIAGTKGKGSTAAMLASISRATGRRTGFYSTPHLNSHRERIRAAGEPIAGNDFARLVEWAQPLVQRLDESPTTYEIGTLLAFEHFRRREIEMAIVEVGIGGRLDATNVLDPELSVITSISYDHMAVLGSTLSEIATQKAGIIKDRTPVVSAPQEPEAFTVIKSTAEARSAPLTVAQPAVAAKTQPVDALQPSSGQPGQVIRLNGREVLLPLLGDHQLTNAGVAISAAGQLGFPPQDVESGLARVSWPGRLEIARENPLIVLDGAHNVDSMEKLADALRRHFRWKSLRIVAGFSADKDIAGMAKVLNALGAAIVLTQSKQARSADPAAIQCLFPNSRTAALPEALQDPLDLTVVTGSLYLVGDARLQLGLVSPEDQDEL
ncbi:MAG: bifunctional folylpolyglutamate synthase/dihydrofolate synthase [Chloroflexi bacterium]|nr:bifunctional folylpolyglutamate synthase/dihydrofolate synthase [Chloroflexota bacterium]